MGAKAAAPAKISDKAIRQELTRILVSKTFSQVERLKRFISFIVGETVEGRGAELKEYLIGVQVFGKAPHSIRAPSRSCASRRADFAHAWRAITETKAMPTS
jgi:hypothetical protein